jgi:DNA polymerase
MLSKKQIRMLQLLDEQILNCKRCGLHNGGRCKPYWTTRSRYAIVGEAPGSLEVVENTPFIGMAGQVLWGTINKITGLFRADFAIINSVNCRPTDGSKNLKPDKGDQYACKQWIRKFLKVIEPEKVLILGNYAMGTMLGRHSGIVKYNATEGLLNSYFKNVPFVISVHPAYTIYNKDDGLQKLEEAIEKFKDVKKSIQLDLFEDKLFEI